MSNNLISGGMTLSIADLQKELGISYATAWNLCKQKDFPSFRIGRRVLIDRNGLEKWIQEQINKK